MGTIGIKFGSVASKAWIWAAAVAGGILYCRHFSTDPGLALYADAAQCLLNGLPLQKCDSAFTYPPVSALMMMPLVPLPLQVRNAVWYVVTLGSIVLCFRLSELLVRRLVPDDWSPRHLAWLRVVCIILSLKFIFAAFANQSFDAVVILLVLTGLYFLANSRESLAGASLAFAAALKATPLLFLPYLVVKRRYFAAATMAVGLVVASLLPDLLFSPAGSRQTSGYLMAWWSQVAGPALTKKLTGNPHTFWFASNPNNYSLRSLLGLFISDLNPQFKPILYTIYAVYSTFIAALIFKTPRSDTALAIDGSLLLISMLMLSPMTSDTHYVALLLPYAALAAVCLHGDRAMRMLSGFILVTHFVLSNASSSDLVGRAVASRANEYRPLVIGTLSLLIVLAVLVARFSHWRAKAIVRDAVG